MKESKFEKFLVEKQEQEELIRETVEKAEVILEKLGSLDAMDAHEIGVQANTPVKFKDLLKAFEKSNSSPDSFMKKVKKLFVGITDEELDVLQSALQLKTFPTRGSGGDLFMKKSDRPADFK